MNTVKAKEPVKLRQKKLAGGNVSLYLATYIRGQREYEFLRLYLIPEKTRDDRQRNRETLALANSIKAQRIVEIQNGMHGFNTASRERMSFFDYFRAQAEKRKKQDSKSSYGIWISTLHHLRRYERRKDITFADITQRWVQGFCNYLDREECNMRVRNGRRPLSPNSKHEYFCKLKTALRQAYNDGIIHNNPTRGTSGFRHEEVTREYLTLEEIRILAATDCDHPEVKRAFLFSCLTGLRRSDVERLTWDEVTQLGGRTRLVFRQKKTGGQEYLDITPQAAQLIGTRGTASGDSNVFGSILAPPTTNKVLRTWTQQAGISKHITFHCARHTFAVLMLTLDTDIYTVSKLLGHRELRTTQIYAKIVDRKKQQAVDNIPEIL